MKKIAILLLIYSFFVIGCLTLPQNSVPFKMIKDIESKIESTENERQLLQFKELNGFFLKNDVKLFKEINFFTVNSQRKLNELLGITKTMSNAMIIPDLNTKILVIIVIKPSNLLNIIKINQVYMIDNNMYVEYGIKQNNLQDLGYFTPSICVFEVSKPKIILNVCFVDTERNAIVIPFGDRTLNSPVNVFDMLTNYTGTYKGTFPSKDSSSVFVELNLKGNYTYNLKQVYSTVNSRIYESSGKWYPSEDLYSFTLNKNKDLSFCFINKTTIEKIDNSGQRVDSGLYRLKK
jgi:hypothetical protein